MQIIEPIFERDDPDVVGQAKFIGPGPINEYLKSEQPSPCAMCLGLFDDKELCAETCNKLTRWQRDSGSVNFEGVQRAEKLIDSGVERCVVCARELEFEDGVVYCPYCLKVHLRVEMSESAVVELLESGWEVAKIARLVGVLRNRIFEIARANGFTVERWHDYSEKTVIVEYAVEHGTKLAGEKYEVRPETVMRYMRQFGAGHKQRYARLQQLAEEGFERGLSAVRVSDQLGVSPKTARKWFRVWSGGGGTNDS